MLVHAHLNFALVFALAPLSALAQTTAPAPPAPAPAAPAATTAATPPADPTLGITFDTVSIRPTVPGPSHITNPLDGDGITVENSTLFEIVRWNFNKSSLRQDQLQGVPDWFYTDNYEIHAKVADSDVAAWQKIGEGGHRMVFRKMLADRFKAAWHFADIDSPVYNLVIDKRGLKIEEAKPGEGSPFFKTAAKTGSCGLNLDGTVMSQTGAALTMCPAPDGYPMYVFQQQHLSSFAKGFVSRFADRPVVDKTGLTTETYNFSLEFAFDQGVDAAATGDFGSSRPSISTALQEQLGLKLEPARGPVEMMVVDHVERPSEN
jgi:uncharacterized protein (TIGR03435 family)